MQTLECIYMFNATLKLFKQQGQYFQQHSDKWTHVFGKIMVTRFKNSLDLITKSLYYTLERIDLESSITSKHHVEKMCRRNIRRVSIYFSFPQPNAVRIQLKIGPHCTQIIHS